MPIIMVTGDTFAVRFGGALSSRRFVARLRGRGRITQQDDEFCQVAFDPAEFRRWDASPPVFEGTAQLTGGNPLAVGLPNLVLERPGGRRVTIDVVSVKNECPRETYELRGSLVYAGAQLQ